MAQTKTKTPKPDAKADAKAKAAKAEAAASAKAERKAERAVALTDAHAEVRRLTDKEASRRSCVCGCGAPTPRAFFVPGHDAKLVSRLLNGEAKAA